MFESGKGNLMILKHNHQKEKLKTDKKRSPDHCHHKSNGGNTKNSAYVKNNNWVFKRHTRNIKMQNSKIKMTNQN